MQNAGLQYGQGVTPVQESPFGGASTVQTAAGNTTSTLRQFRKKENLDKSQISGGIIQNNPTGGGNNETNSSHVARVAPHNHYPHKQNEYYRYPPQYQEYGSPVKYSEIAETVPQQIPHLDHLPSSIISKHKEKEYDMCNIPPPPPPPSQQTHLVNKAYQEHQLNTQQSYHHAAASEMAAALHHHQYIHKEVSPPQGPQMYKPESQYIPKDGNYNHQIPPFIKYNLPQTRNYTSIDNYQRMDPHIARTLMPEHHMRDYTPDYTAIEQSRMYSQKQRYYPTPLPNTNYAHNYPSHRNISTHQQYNYPSCNYPPRTNQMGRYAINMERSISPRRTYPENIEMGMNFSAVQKLPPTGYPTSYSGYAQHYQQHRRPPHPPPHPVQEYYHHPQQHPHTRQYIPQHHHPHQEVEENHVASNNIRQYLENWAEEEAPTELSASTENPKFIPRLNRDDTNEVYVINASDLPQYLENGVPLVTSENGQYVFKSNVSIDTTGAIKILEKNTNTTGIVENSSSTSSTETPERVVSLHIVENPKTPEDCLDSAVATINLIPNPSPSTGNVFSNSKPNLNEIETVKKCDSSKPDNNVYQVPQETTQNFDESLLPTVPSSDNKNEEILNNVGHEELDKIVEDTLTSSNIDIPVVETCNSELPKVDHEENGNTYIPDDLNLDLEAKSDDDTDIIDLSTSKKCENDVKTIIKHMPSLIDDTTTATPETDQKKEENTPESNQELEKTTPETVQSKEETETDQKIEEIALETNQELEKNTPETELKKEETSPRTEEKKGDEQNESEDSNSKPEVSIDQLCDELRERRKAASRKKRIFSVDDIIYRIGANSIQNRRKSLHSTLEKSDEDLPNNTKDEIVSKLEENRAKSCPTFEIPEEPISTHLLAFSDEIISCDKTPEFLESVELKRNTENAKTPPEDNEEETEPPSRKRKLKEELSFEERFVEPYQEEEHPPKSPDGQIYRSILRVEENNVLLEIGGELVEINVGQINGKKVITLTPMSSSTIVDINENYEETMMPVLEEETYPENCEENEKTLPVLDKMVDPEITNNTQQEMFEELILNENEIIIGDESLEEEINLDLENDSVETAKLNDKGDEEEVKTVPVLLLTKASRKLYEDKAKKTIIKRSTRRPRVKTKEKQLNPEFNKKKTVSSSRKTPKIEETQSALRELIKRRKMRKEKLRLKYSQYATTTQWKDKEVKKTRTPEISKTKKQNLEEIPSPGIVSTTNPTLSNFQTVQLENDSSENKAAATKNETKFMKNSTPRDLSLTKNVNEHYLSRKDHTNLKKKLSIQEYNSRKRKLEIKTNSSDEIHEKRPSISLSNDSGECEAATSSKPATIYAKFDFEPNCLKDPRRRNASLRNSSDGINMIQSPECISPQIKPNEFPQIPSILLGNSLMNDSYDMQIQDYKTYKTALLEQSSRPLKITTRRKTLEIMTERNPELEDLKQGNCKKKTVIFDDNVQINEINTTETKSIKSKPESYCEVSSSCEEVKTNDWEDSNSPKDNNQLSDAFAETFLSKTPSKLETTPLENKRKLIIDINDFDTSSINNELKTPYKDCSSVISVKNYKEEVDSKLNSLNIQIPKKRPSEDDILMHKFLRREQLNSDEIKRIRKIIYLKKRIQQLQNNENYEVKRKMETIQSDLKLQLKKIDVEQQQKQRPPRRKKKRFRNLYSESPDNDNSASETHEETAGEFSVYEGKGVKLIFKRKTDLLQLQPVVKLQRCGYIETMAKDLKFIE